MGTKNNPKNRVKNLAKKQYNGKDIEPVYYYGVHGGHGKYMAARYAGGSELVADKAGKPLTWDQVSAS